MALIDSEMKAIGAAKMAMPVLTPATLWKKTGTCVVLVNSYKYITPGFSVLKDIATSGKVDKVFSLAVWQISIITKQNSPI